MSVCNVKQIEIITLKTFLSVQRIQLLKIGMRMDEMIVEII